VNATPEVLVKGIAANGSSWIELYIFDTMLTIREPPTVRSTFAKA